MYVCQSILKITQSALTNTQLVLTSTAVRTYKYLSPNIIIFNVLVFLLYILTYILASSLYLHTSCYFFKEGASHVTLGEPRFGTNALVRPE